MAVRANLVVEQGSDYIGTIDLTNEDSLLAIDLTGYTGQAQMRKHYLASQYFSFTVQIDAPNGSIDIIMPGSVSQNIPSGRYVWDCKLTSSTNSPTRIVEGIVTIKPQVTR